MNIPKELFYTKSHEWAKNENGKIRVGISDHAQHEITDVVHVELPKIGLKVQAGQPCAVVESVKSAFDIYAPVFGVITEVNEKLHSSPELINSSPYQDGYLFVIETPNTLELNNLMKAEDYEKLIKE